MNSIKDYSSRKFYSKVGRASNASSKPHYPPNQHRSFQDITMDYIKVELEKAKNENLRKIRLKRKHNSHTSSFLSTSREVYMRAFKPTSSETPVPGKYTPKFDLIKPSPSPVLKFRDQSESAKRTRNKQITLPSCIDTSIFECSYPKKHESVNATVNEVELENHAQLKRFIKSKSLRRRKNFVDFEKQSKRLFLPNHKVSEERFEVLNYFPQISTKAKRLPIIDFTCYRDRDEEKLSNSPGFYDYDDRIAKSMKALHGFDMGKVRGRDFKDEWKSDTVNKDKVSESFNKIMPKTYVGSPCFEKTTNRDKKSPTFKLKKM